MVTSIFLRGLCGYVWANMIHTLLPPKGAVAEELCEFTQSNALPLKTLTGQPVHYAACYDYVEGHKASSVTNSPETKEWT